MTTFNIELGTYSPEGGLALTWVDGFTITVRAEANEVVVEANAAGLRSLAQHLLTLADDGVPGGTHVHLEPSVELEDDSQALILERSALQRRGNQL